MKKSIFILLIFLVLINTGCATTQSDIPLANNKIEAETDVIIKDEEVTIESIEITEEKKADKIDVIEENADIKEEASFDEAKPEDENIKEFVFSIIDENGEETFFNLKTNKQTLKEALLDEGLIDGENGSYGLFVTTVNGVKLNAAKDHKYWALYVNGKYATKGVDYIIIENGNKYSFKVQGV